MKQKRSLEELRSTDSLAFSQGLRARVSKFLPWWLLTELSSPSNWRAKGLSQFTKHVAKPPSNVAEAETHLELSELGNVVVRGGWPDFLVITGSEDIFLVEVKARGDEVRPHQLVVLELLARAGIDTYIKRPEGYEAVGDSRRWDER